MVAPILCIAAILVCGVENLFTDPSLPVADDRTAIAALINTVNAHLFLLRSSCKRRPQAAPAAHQIISYFPAVPNDVGLLRAKALLNFALETGKSNTLLAVWILFRKCTPPAVSKLNFGFSGEALITSVGSTAAIT